MGHLRADEILRLLGSAAGGETNLLHLLGCARCRARAAELAALDETPDEFSAPQAPEVAAASGRALARVWASLGKAQEWKTAELERDAAGAGRLYDELMSRPAEERARAVDDDPRFQSPGLARLLLAASEEVPASEPARAEALAERALSIADRLEPRWSALARGTRSHAWCLLGDARRRSGKDAETAFRAAARHLEAEPLDSRARAVFCHRLALLRHEEERTDEALALLERAAALFEAIEDGLGLAESLAASGRLRLEEGDAEGARAAFTRGLAALGPAVPAQLALALHHGIALVEADLGRTAAAGRALKACRRLHDLLPAPLDRLRAEAREAEVAELCGRSREAESIRREAIERFRQAGSTYDALFVALDLGRAYAEEARPDQVERLRAEIEPLLRSPEIHPRARAAISMAFHLACRPGVFARVAEFVARSRHNPDLAFGEIAFED